MKLPSEPSTPATDHTLLQVKQVARAIQQGCATGDTALLNNIIDAVADPILVKDGNLRFLLVNQALCEFTGIPRERFIGRTDTDLFPAAQAETFNTMDRLVFATGRSNVNEEDHLHADGSVRTIRTTKTMFVDANGNVLVGIFTDLTALRATQRELEAANRRLQELAHNDHLTGLPNRRSFEETLERTIAAAQRHDESFAVLFIDLNGFKQVNDTYGHSVGDELLRNTARRLATAARASDFVARLGGDEFAVVARSVDIVESSRLAKRLAAEVGVAQGLTAAEVSVSISIGIAHFPADGVDGSELIKKADAAMYRAKRVTGQLFEYHDESQAALAKRRFLIETQLRRDVDAGAIEMHLQPIVSLEDGRCLGYEALARWNPPGLGPIGPDEFIPIAEQCRLIDRLGATVLRRACEFIARCGHADQYVSVNLSSHQLRDDGFVATVRAALAASGATPSQLALELTESALGTSEAAATLQHLRDTGVALFIDDFGVGYSNLMRLHTLPFDVIKIDRGFVGQLRADGSSVASAMVRTVLALAAELGLKVIAEGIEHEWQVKILRELGVRMGQGYLYGAPRAPGAWPKRTCEADVDGHVVGDYTIATRSHGSSKI